MKHLSKSLIALFLLSASLLSCGDAKKPAETTEDVQSDTEALTQGEPEITPDTPDELTFPGRTFTILSGTYNDYCRIGADESDGEVLNDARRTMMNSTAERFNIEVKEEAIDIWGTLATVNNLIASGDETYNILNILDRFAMTALVNGYLRPIDDLEHVDFSKPWWNPEITDQMLIGDTRYLASSEANVLMYADTMAFWINTTLASAYDIDVSEIYDHVRNGSWTMDKMMEYAALVTGEVNGDNKMDENDRWGYMPLDTNVAATAFITAGGKQSIVREGDRFAVTWDDPLYMELAENAHDILYSKNSLIPPDRRFPDAFTESRVLFMTGIFHTTANNIGDMKDDYTCVPMPKYTEDQESYLCANYDVMFFCAPKFISDTEFSGAVVDWLSYEGNKVVKDAYIESTMKGKKALTTEMREMIGLCLDSSMIDLGSIFAYDILSYDSLWLNVFQKSTFQFSSYMARKEGALVKQLTEIVEAVEENQD